MTSISTENLAQLLEITPRRIQQLTAQGIIPKSAHGRYTLESAVKGYIRFLRDRKLPGDASPGDGTEADDFQKSRAKLYREKAEQEAMKRQKLAGELVPVDQIETVWRSVTMAVRSHLLAIPSKCAVRVGMCKNAVEAQALLRREVEEALLELSKVTFDLEAPTDDESEFDSDSDDDDSGDGPASESDSESVG